MSAPGSLPPGNQAPSPPSTRDSLLTIAMHMATGQAVVEAPVLPRAGPIPIVQVLGEISASHLADAPRPQAPGDLVLPEGGPSLTCDGTRGLSHARWGFWEPEGQRSAGLFSCPAVSTAQPWPSTRQPRPVLGGSTSPLFCSSYSVLWLGQQWRAENVLGAGGVRVPAGQPGGWLPEVR